MRQAGRYLKEYRTIRASQKIYIVLPKSRTSFCGKSQPITRFGLMQQIIFSDILMVPWAMNLNVRFEPGIGPYLTHWKNQIN